MCLGLLSGLLIKRCNTTLPGENCLFMCSWRWKTKNKKQFPLAAYWFELRSDKWDSYGICVMVLCSQWRWWYLAVALSSGYRRLLTRRKVLSQNDSVFTGIHVEACSGNQPVMDPAEPFNVTSSALCIINISNLFITSRYGDVIIAKIRP